ncbi:hypothetical protein QYE76_014941 [Lolium multiflorum]|uniref:NB-ARC domain-containing protein n=1 Tax=Lolium multiflorum TaxID=4521 RepID=A0AAD8U5N5_LOLMU|nr:hypothetical protein QYE76_014941 [Lolium multiflorum]
MIGGYMILLRRYFIIIDDLWDISAWNVIKCVFPENDLGSRVIVTTRKLGVAQECCFSRDENIFRMKPLSEEDSRRLFFDRIFGSEEACPSQLKDSSTEILKKCGGLPLAIISISSLLASEQYNQTERWAYVQNSLGSISGTNPTLEAMREILSFSYKDLPRYLKTCFLYLGMYPEDHTIRRRDLENRWVAEGFVSKEHGQSLEQTARSYFNELVNRSLIQPVELNRDRTVLCCKVHDMMLDLILHKSAEENFMTVIDSPESTTGLVQKVRRMLFCLNGARLPGDISLSQVRSLAFFGSCKNIPSLTGFKFLRVFTAEFASSSVDDEGKLDLTRLNKLHQLRYLRIQDCRRCQLPAQIRGLQQLETFDVDDGSAVPSDIFHVPSLLCLRAPGVKRLPEGIGKMTSLKYLLEFDVLNNSLDNIKDLGELTNLNTLFITCENGFVTEDRKISEDEKARHIDVLSTSLRKLCSLKFLCVRSWKSGILEQLTSSPLPAGLVTFRMLVTSRVPNWIGELHNLLNLRLSVKYLDQDGLGILAELPALLDLELELLGNSFPSELEIVPEEMINLYGTSFASLEHFSIRSDNMPWLTFQAGAMVKLQRLSIAIHAVGWKHEAAPIGIEHLLALEKIFVGIGCSGATESERKNAESAFRSAIDMHPRNPHVKINCGDFMYGFWS